ncbi:homoserine dehydrogenase [Galenea microaerophila]
MKTIQIGLLGFGTVGGGTLQILQQNIAEIRRRLGVEIAVKIIAVRDLNKPRAVETGSIELTTEPEKVVNHPEVDIVVELMGGTGLAKKLLEQAIQNGKHIVTANKALIAEHGNELFTLAAIHKVHIFYEAAVAGGIPIIKALREGLAANRMQWVAGIINGTGNYILSEMKKPGADFDSVLKVAQDLGYAEADPTFDVEGIDAAHKLTILASIAFGIPLHFEKVYTEGISQVTAEDIQFAEQMGYQIKHLGVASKTDKGVSLRVHPTLVANNVLLANVNGVMNAVMTYGEPVGETLYYGPGAGAGPTASAVVADIVDCIRAMQANLPVAPLGYQQLDETLEVVDIQTVASAFYLRFFAKDHAGVLAKVSTILAEEGISIEKLHQEPCQKQPEDATIVMLTDQVVESAMEKAIAQLSQLPEVDGEVMRIRIGDFESYSCL